MKHARTKTEAIAGLTTFFTMAYIVVVNPSILSTEGTGMAFSGVLTATVLLCFVMTLLMGVYAKLPYAVAPGMGINAFFTYSIILGQKIAWPIALGMVFWAGVIFLLVSLTSLRAEIAKSIPVELRAASAAGIGIFLTFIGLKNAGIITSDPVTFVKLGAFSPKTLLSFLGLILSTILLYRKNPLAFLAGIFLVTVLSGIFGFIHIPKPIFSTPDFRSVFFKLDVWGALKLSFLPTIISIFFTDLFDSISTFVGVSHSAGLVEKNGDPVHLKEGLIVDAWATLGAGLFGTSSGTAYIESAAGIEAGGRTGLTSVFTALCFLPCFFIAPLAGMVPEYATAPVLILVGALLFRSLSQIRFDRFEDALPCFLTVILIPLTFSITQGILWGFISHVGLYLLAGRRKEIKPLMFGIAGVSLLLILSEQMRAH